MTHTDKPGSIGKGSYEQFPGEANYQFLGLPRDAESNTAWRRQGKAAEDRDSNRRPIEGNKAWVAHFHLHANRPALARPAVLAPVFRTSGTGWHC